MYNDKIIVAVRHRTIYIRTRRSNGQCVKDVYVSALSSIVHYMSITCNYTGWPIKNVPNFRMALCNREIKMNQLSSEYLMSKHMRISLDIFA